MNIPIKTHLISSKTDRGTDQETRVLISLNIKYSVLAASVITYDNNTATYYLFLRRRYINCTVFEFSFLEKLQIRLVFLW